MRRSLINVVSAAVMLTVCAPALAQEVGSARVVPIQVTGDAAARFSLVILGDGYTAAEMPLFRSHVEKHLNILWSLEPFRSYRNYINVYAVEIVSGESGITCDPAHRQPRTTPLQSRFGGGCDNPNARGITLEQEAARRYARMATPDFDQILTIANTETYGGIGGSVATTSGGNALGPYITPHELGHSLGRLQDEYTYSARGVRGRAYDGEEPNSIHHTLLTEEQMRAQQQKWWRWLGEPSESGGIIGRYEGGMSRTTGVWRPSRHSMMISLGYYFDQVSRERMAQRISGQVELIAASTPADKPVNPADVIWIETPHPNFHDLDVTWEVDGRGLTGTGNVRTLQLASLGLGPGTHTVTVRVVDPTDYVRDPVIRDTSFTATRTWTVDPNAPRGTEAARPAFTTWRDTARAVAAEEWVYVETTHPPGRVHAVTWHLDGRVVQPGPNDRIVDVGQLGLSPGTHRLRATVHDPANPDGGSPSLEWTIDNTGPTVEYTLSQPVHTVERPDGARHFLFRDQFTMKLEPTDDQPGHVVAEFRVNGDGWHHYYGWPDAPPGTPYLFTPRGTTIKELIYGSLSSEGLSPQPWEAREPGWGTHRIEYRARDAAGNIGETKDFHVTFLPGPACTVTIANEHRGALAVNNGVTCVNGGTVTGPVTVAAGASLVAVNARLAGTLTTNGAADVEIIGTSVDGAVRIQGTTGNITIFGSSLNQAVTLTANRTVRPPVLAGNRLGATLACDGNTAAPQDHGSANTVAGGATGQCAMAESRRPMP